MVNANKLNEGLSFYSRGCQLMGDDVQLMVNMLSRAVVQGYTLRPREVRLLRRIVKDLFTIVPFVIILIIPLSPLGHVLVFSFIQRFFPDFYPSQFTEQRQNIMSMYTSITSPAGEAVGVVGLPLAGAPAAEDSLSDSAASDANADSVKSQVPVEGMGAESQRP